MESKKVNGFTLIEILVVISLIGILFSVGIAGYRTFESRQELDNTFRDLGSDLNLARQRALSGEKPVGCTGTLAGYRITFPASDRYTVSGVCDNNTPTDSSDDTSVVVKSVVLGRTVRFDPIPSPSSFFYIPVGRGADLSSALILTLRHLPTGRTITGNINQAGNLERQ